MTEINERNLTEVPEAQERILCSVCGEDLTNGDYNTFNGRIYCDDCYDENTFVCECCGQRELRERSYMDSHTEIYEHCYDEYYTTCEDCGAIIHCDDANYINGYPYCDGCYNRNNHYNGIHDYCYKPDPIFRGKGNRFFGVELEVDEGGQNDCTAEDVLNLANVDYEDNIYIKSDGSLNDGFEIVSHPMTLDYHMKNMNWKTIMDYLIREGYTSHKAKTCGLHCHINRTAFGKTCEQQDDAIARVIYFVEHHWEQMLRFSRRTEAQMQRWAARYGIKNNPKALMDDVKKNNFNRYRCINLQNYNTIEFRMFRGTLKYNSFISTLQIVNEICNVAVSLSDDEMTALAWGDFISKIDFNKNKELLTYLTERNLYTITEGGNN